MDFNILICDSFDRFGETVCGLFNERGIPAAFCISDVSIMKSMIFSSDFDAVLLFPTYDIEMYAEFVRDVLAEKSDVKFFVSMFGGEMNYISRLFSVGVSMCLSMPISVNRLADAVCYYMADCDSLSECLEAACFLRDMGFGYKTAGFAYLAEAVNICLRNPDSLESIYENIYGYIAEKYRTQPKAVERAMRNLLKKSKEDGVTERISDAEADIVTAHDLLVFLCERYVKKRYFAIRR